jgi:hypothetical protein
VVVLGAGWGLAIYYRNLFVYATPGNEMDARQVILAGGMRKSFIIIVVYLIYATVRESSLNWLTKPSQWMAFRIRLTNQVTGALAIYMAFFFYLYSFDIMDDKAFAFFCWPPPVILTYLTHIFWLFPFKGKRSFFNGPVFRRLLISTLLWALPFCIIFAAALNAPGSVVIPFILTGWLISLMIVTPLSWFIYKRTKDKILRFQGLEIALDKSEADLQFLRSQINPHFLFNSLNNIYSLVYQGSGQALTAIAGLSDLLRYMLYDAAEKVPLATEMDYINKYISLQQLRFEYPVVVDMKVEGTMDGVLIPPLLLIPFVENAFKHGDLQQASLSIILKCDGKKISFYCTNRKGQQQKDPGGGIGMENVKRRLSLLYPDKHVFLVEDGPVNFSVKLELNHG